MSYCFECGGLGLEDKECPSCGREPSKLNLGKVDEKEVKNFITRAKGVKIPEEYIGVDWSPEMFWRYKKAKENDRLLQHYVSQLEKIHGIFVGGSIPSKGAIIIAPSTYSKVTFAYSCMQHALRNGHYVAELLDTIELKRLLVLASENMNYKMYGYIDYDRFMTADVMFITVSKTEYRKQAFAIIEEVLGRRSRIGLATFVISRYSMEDMSHWDRSRDFVRIKDSIPSDNFKKFPAIVSYKEG